MIKLKTIPLNINFPSEYQKRRRRLSCHNLKRRPKLFMKLSFEKIPSFSYFYNLSLMSDDFYFW